MIDKIPSIYESFNARTLTNRELCDSFIINEYFQELGSSNNTIMVGPRGSGKTTLMRMLQVETLNIWNAPPSKKIKELVTFSGVFIPTDRLWKSQFDRMKNVFSENKKIEAIAVSIFIYHILEKLVATLNYRCKINGNEFRASSLSKLDESELVSELSTLWKVHPRIVSLRSLGITIAHKKKEISDFFTKDINACTTPTIIEGEISTILESSISIINSFLDEDGEKWCFLFDELELAPEEIIQPLVNSMRGGPADIILKLSLSPYHRNLYVTGSSESSMKGQDLSLINLTGTSDKTGLEFSKKLCGNIFKRNGLNNPIEEYFLIPNEVQEKKIFEELSKKDRSFSNYLSKNKIVVDEMGDYVEKNKRPTIRKIKFVAYLRNYYLKEHRRASRKTQPESYAGFEKLCQAMEYNPRMLIGIMNKLIKKAGNDNKISISAQLKCLSETYESFKSLLCTIAIESERDNMHTINDLIETIAKRFQKEITGKDFIPEPKGTITFKKDENEGYVDAIGFALNAGALIIDKDMGNALFNKQDIKNARCRLSYLFSHQFGLLTSKGRIIELCDILDEANVSSIKVIDPIENNSKIAKQLQMDLL